MDKWYLPILQTWGIPIFHGKRNEHIINLFAGVVDDGVQVKHCQPKARKNKTILYGPFPDYGKLILWNNRSPEVVLLGLDPTRRGRREQKNEQAGLC